MAKKAKVIRRKIKMPKPKPKPGAVDYSPVERMKSRKKMMEELWK